MPAAAGPWAPRTAHALRQSGTAITATLVVAPRRAAELTAPAPNISDPEHPQTKQDLAWIVVVQPNGSRLSCGALKKDSFPNLRAPTASSAC